MKFLTALRDQLNLSPVCPWCETWHSTERVESAKYIDADGCLHISIYCRCRHCGAYFVEELTENENGLRIDIEETDPFDHNGSEADE